MVFHLTKTTGEQKNEVRMPYTSNNSVGYFYTKYR